MRASPLLLLLVVAIFVVVVVVVVAAPAAAVPETAALVSLCVIAAATPSSRPPEHDEIWGAFHRNCGNGGQHAQRFHLRMRAVRGFCFSQCVLTNRRHGAASGYRRLRDSLVGRRTRNYCCHSRASRGSGSGCGSAAGAGACGRLAAVSKGVWGGGRGEFFRFQEVSPMRRELLPPVVYPLSSSMVAHAFPVFTKPRATVFTQQDPSPRQLPPFDSQRVLIRGSESETSSFLYWEIVSEAGPLDFERIQSGENPSPLISSSLSSKTFARGRTAAGE